MDFYFSNQLARICYMLHINNKSVSELFFSSLFAPPFYIIIIVIIVMKS